MPGAPRDGGVRPQSHHGPHVLLGLQMPAKHWGAVAQQGWPLSPQQGGCPVPPQQAPSWHVPTRQAPRLPTHLPSVSQHPIEVPTPLHLLLAQQASPDAPQAWQVPSAHTCRASHMVPAVKQTAPLQQLPPVQVFAAQHISSDPPHAVQTPPLQTLPAALQFVSLATHALVVGSQHEPVPVQAVPLTQQAAPFAPQVEHVPLKQTLFVPPHARSGPTQVLLVGSQQLLGDVHVLPAQQAAPVVPQAGASSGASFGASPGESLGESAGESARESASESRDESAGESVLESSPEASVGPSFDCVASSPEALSPPLEPSAVGSKTGDPQHHEQYDQADHYDCKSLPQPLHGHLLDLRMKRF